MKILKRNAVSHKLKFLLLLFPLAFMACSDSTEVNFEKSTGKVNKVAEGSRFHITASEDHKVGSGLWSMTNDFDNTIVGYVNSQYNSDEGGSVDFNFEAIKKGTTEVTICQSFARDTIQRMTFIVEVE